MHTPRQSTLRSLLFRGRWPTLCVLSALAASVALAAPPDKDAAKPEEPPVEPLFPIVEIRPENLASLIFTAPLTPRIGPWSAVADVYAGAHPEVQVWNLRGPFSTKPGRIQVGASSLFLTGFMPLRGLNELAMLQAGEDRDCWALIDTDVLRPFPPFFLKPGIIRDRNKNGFANGDPEIEVYSQVLVLAHFTSAKAFAKTARHDISYAHMFNEPERYRGQVVRVSGRLIRLRRFLAPDTARGQGVGYIYEGWILTDRYGENPACVVFTDLPDGLTIDEDRRLDIEGVRFDGYFYKRYRYQAYDSKKKTEFRDAPLLVGHTISGPFAPGAKADAVEDNWGHNLIWLFLCVVGGSFVGVIGLTCWYRYHDQRVRRRIFASRNASFVPPPEEAASEGEETPETFDESPPRPRWRDYPPTSN